MTTTILLVCSLIAAGPTSEDLSTYEAASATVGRAPEANVKLALWCEAHGLHAERLKHLARAVLSEPTNAMARGLLGLVAYQGQWKRPETVARKVQADGALVAKLAEYNARRARAHETADSQWSLAIWCEQNGLTAEALAHFTAVTRLDPSREAAWKRLDCKKVNGRWLTEAQIVAEKDEAEAQKKADKLWKPLLTKYRSMLADKRKKDAAEQALLDVTDPRAVPMVMSVFVAGNSAYHAQAVQILGQIDAAASSRALAFLAVFDDSAEVRRAATETLKRRDPREFAGMLIALLRDPLKYEVRPVGGPGSPGAIFVEGKRFNVQRIYAPPPLAITLTRHGQYVGLDGYGVPTIIGALQYQNAILMSGSSFILPSQGHTSAPHYNVARLSEFMQEYVHATENQFAGVVNEIQKMAATAEQQLKNDVNALDTYNEQVSEINARVIPVLSGIAGKNFGQGCKVWSDWYVNQLGYAASAPDPSSKPTIVENVPIAYQPQNINGYVQSTPDGYKVFSCFGAGTLVRTLDGSRPIESIRVGDRVLTQDVKSGALGYQPVTVVHHNPPSPTFLVKVGKDTIVSSPFHRFWIAGTGWKMARDLKGGELLRLLDGPARVDSVEEGPVQLVYNLDVAGDHDFFAGASAALVHDNTLPDTRLVAFDAAPAVAVAGSPGR